MNRTYTFIVCALVALFAVAGCTNDPLYPEHPLIVTTQGLPPLDGGACYELWISYPIESASTKQPAPLHNDNAFFSAGRFNVSSTGALTLPDGTGIAKLAVPSGYNPNLVLDVVISVEHINQTSAGPDARVLAGDFSGTSSVGTATLTPNGADAFATILDSASRNTMFASYALDAPTSGDTTRFASGIWFIASSFTPARSSLILPIQPLITTNPMWTYEAWLMHRVGSNVEYVSLGKFDDPNAADADGAGAAAGTNTSAAYNLPGGDFVSASGSRTLNDGSYGVVVSVQPTGFTLGSPLIVLFQTDTIKSTLTRLQLDAMTRKYSSMSAVVTLNR